ncbi:PLC-like phosphodiesterase [Choiromyces venosus 120613-1]|uniref:Phosphoinositide phospholipase C n=1 Tax=Choiromyces venosus 120613-1 TaxID=1336337 RepID=A0A3N4J8G7_9PEZI|nr:PLC-like phosphodiesterase [Choiromyces venosus 120613-1]
MAETSPAQHCPTDLHIQPQYFDVLSNNILQAQLTASPSSSEPPSYRQSVTSVSSSLIPSSPTPSPPLNSDFQAGMAFWSPKTRPTGRSKHVSSSSSDLTHIRRDSQSNLSSSIATPSAALSSIHTTTDPPKTPTQPRSKTSLIRRVSNKLRRRTSSSTPKDSEDRSGPVLARLRSDSLNAGETGRLGIQKKDEPFDDEDYEHAIEGEDEGTGTSTSMEASHPNESIGAIGVMIPDILKEGTAMTRVTRKKKIQRIFSIDPAAARVTWDATKQSSKFYIDDIKEIRLGANARNYREEFQVSSEVEDRWATIIYTEPETGKLKTLHVIAPTIQILELWTATLERVVQYRTEMMAGLSMPGERFVDAHWRSYMESQCPPKTLNSNDEKLGFEDVERLCRRLHVNCSRQFLKDRFKQSDKDKSGYLNFVEFREFVRLLKQRDEIVDIWKDAVTDRKAGMSIEEFRTFLKEEQKVDIESDPMYIDKIFRKFTRQPTSQQQVTRKEGAVVRMSMDAFSDFLLSSSYNPPLLPAPLGNDLRRPLNEYYISSSHNTYLLGRQVAGESSIEAYIRVLKRGCRCVEIDCWDGDDGRPIVTHGHTGTSDILFLDVITAIKKYSFVASTLPVILSLEVHCDLEQQVEMAKTLRNVLGDALITEPFMTNALILPSPNVLRNKILVKVKGSSKQDSLMLNNDFSSIEKRAGSTHNLQNSLHQPPFPKSGIPSENSSSTSESEGQDESKVKKRQESVKIAPELGSLGVYTRGQRFSNFALPESKTSNHVFSFQEKKFEKFTKDPEKKVQLEKHNVRYLMRVYPSGFRVNSSNYDPIGFWRQGVQMVALNWQTYDLGLQINEAMFASEEDRGGYVLKPKELRGSRTTFDPPADANTAALTKNKKVTTFSVEIISAQQLPKPKDHKDKGLHPFVVVEVFSADDKAKDGSVAEGGIGVDSSDAKGISGLGAPQKRRTKVVKDDGFHPLFREKMVFKVTTKFEELVFVRFSVYNADDGDSSDRTLIATYTAKLLSLQQVSRDVNANLCKGYRHLPLYDLQGEQFLFSMIFVKINVSSVSLADREPLMRASTMEAFKSTAKSVLQRGFSTNRHSVKRLESEKMGKNNGQEPTTPKSG